ncbi:MAG: protein kinase, partial [Candidatus Binatia bacterium]
VHRDLKPANIKVTEDGRGKLLDFGLAKALVGDSYAAAQPDSPTITVQHTRPGVVLGTAAYMSPEQARGKPLDKRTDIWSYGCCLYEALTGRLAFGGESVTDTLAAIVREEPAWDRLPPAAPAGVHRVLRRCLMKEPRERLRDIGDARFELGESNAGDRATAQKAGPDRRAAFVGGVAAGVLLGAAVVAIALWSWSQPATLELERKTPVKLTMELPPAQRLWTNIDWAPWKFTPNGRELVFIGGPPNARQIFVRYLNDLEVQPVPGTRGVRDTALFVSPDGKWVGYYKDKKLRKTRLAGGVPVPLLDSRDLIWGGSWEEDDTIIFSRGPVSGLFQISADGGEPRALTQLDAAKGEVWHGNPCPLPGGRGVLFGVSVGNYDVNHVELLRLDTGERRSLIKDAWHCAYTPSGHLVFGRDGTLFAVRFDPDRLEVTGPEVPVLSEIQVDPFFRRATLYAVSATGTLVYVPSDQRIGEGRLVWSDRHGDTESLPAAPGLFINPALSPDGRQIAVDVCEGTQYQLSVFDVASGIPTQITLGDKRNQGSVWSPDGKQIAFLSNRNGPYNMYLMNADGSGQVKRLKASERFQNPGSWSPDGRFLAYIEGGDEQNDIWILPMTGEGSEPQPFEVTEHWEHSPMFSPNGHFIAFVSNESGRPETYVKEFVPGRERPTGKRRISRDGGWEPRWSRDGQELFYRSLDGTQMMAVKIETEPTFEAGEPHLLFEDPNMLTTNGWEMYGYDVAPDGRLLTISAREERERPMKLNVVLNWFEELKAKVPTGK